MTPKETTTKSEREKNDSKLTTTSPSSVGMSNRDSAEEENSVEADRRAARSPTGASVSNTARSLHGTPVNEETSGQSGRTQTANADRNSPGITASGDGDYVDDDSTGNEDVSNEEDSNVPGQPSRATRRAAQSDRKDKPERDKPDVPTKAPDRPAMPKPTYDAPLNR